MQQKLGAFMSHKWVKVQPKNLIVYRNSLSCLFTGSIQILVRLKKKNPAQSKYVVCRLGKISVLATGQDLVLGCSSQGCHPQGSYNHCWWDVTPGISPDLMQPGTRKANSTLQTPWLSFCWHICYARKHPVHCLYLFAVQLRVTF